jgi:phosphoglycolate phosphatase-like HAD superfamily hydrolase
VGCLWGFRDRDELLGAGAQRVIESPLELLNALK